MNILRKQGEEGSWIQDAQYCCVNSRQGFRYWCSVSTMGQNL